MTKVMTVSQVRADIYNIIDETALTHEPILITGKRTNAVMLSQEDYIFLLPIFYSIFYNLSYIFRSDIFIFTIF